MVAQAVETLTPKRCEIALYSVLVPSLHSAFATLFSTGIATHTALECCIHPLSSEHKC